MSAGGGEKTESPTRKRLTEARRQGIFASSNVLVLGISLLSLVVVVSVVDSFVLEMFRESFSGLTENVSPNEDFEARKHINEQLWKVFGFAAPIMGIIWLAFTLSSFGLIANNFTVRKLFSRGGTLGLNAEEILRRFAGVLLVVLFASTFFFVFVSFVADDLSNLALLGPARSAEGVLLLFTVLLGSLGFAMVFAGILDFGVALWTTNRQLRMTRGELVAEQKENEMSGQLKASISEKRRKVLSESLERVIPNSTLIVNGGEIAVALSYDYETGNPPVVIAKGVGLKAIRIRELGVKSKIPQVSESKLCAELSNLGIGERVSENSFESLALAFRIAGVGI